MKPIWKDGTLTVELHKPDTAILEKASDIGEALTAMGQTTGKALTDAVDAVLNTEETVAEEPTDDDRTTANPV